MENKITQGNCEIAKSYDLVFVGGGPATISFISYLFRNKLHDKVFPYTNILIIEKSESFGSGCLGKYGINTNTSAEGFVRLICTPEQKTKKGGLALSPNSRPMKTSKNYEIKEDKKDKKSVYSHNIYQVKKESQNNHNTEIMKQIDEIVIDKGYKKQHYKPLTMFLDFYKQAPAQTLLKIGNRPAPLPLVGHYLDSFGNYVLDFIHKHYNKNIFLSSCEVTSIKLQKNDEFTISLLKNNMQQNIKTKSLILATGGRQKTSQRSTNEIQKLVGDNNFFYSDSVLKETGYKSLITNLLSKRKRIVIIGGSHSGFSCAWILMNHPASYKSVYISDSSVQYNIKCNQSCQKCLTDHCCFGKICDKNWEFSNEDKSLITELNDKIEIVILYRDHIKVHYPSEQDAINDNYTCYERRNAVNKNGNVYPFIGLRGDAKELYRNITKGNEHRVRLVKAETWEEQRRIISQEECAVIWACGYETQNIPILDPKGSIVELNCTEEGGMLEVDKELRIVDKNKNPLRNFYGIGQGYATFSIELVGGKKARADAVNLYNTYVSKKLYKSLMGFFSKLFIDFNEKKKKNDESLSMKVLTFDMSSKPKRNGITKENKKVEEAKNPISERNTKDKHNIVFTKNYSNSKSLKENIVEVKTEIENIEKNKSNYGLINRKFDIKINFPSIDERNQVDSTKNQKYNTIQESKKFSLKDKKEYAESLRTIKK